MSLDLDMRKIELLKMKVDILKLKADAYNWQCHTPDDVKEELEKLLVAISDMLMLKLKEV